MARTGKRARKRRRSIDIESPLKDAIPTTFTLAVGRLTDLEGSEEAVARGFAQGAPDVHDLLSRVYVLHRLLMERRATLDDDSELRSSLDLLGAKAFADARGAHILLARGYPMASLGPLRAAAEASDLMAYLLAHPEELGPWRSEDPRFDSLGWIRKELPNDPTPSYEFMGLGMHANWRLIPQLMTDTAHALSTHYEIVVGPSSNTAILESEAIHAAFQLMKTVAVLYEHQPDLVSELWLDEFNRCQSLLRSLLQKAIKTAEHNLALRTLQALAIRSSIKDRESQRDARG
jgi:hypothetical protein